MNAQERYEKFVLPEDVNKVSVEKDPKITNAIAITVEREDHTIGNLVRHQLHRDSEVLFCGYKISHPLEHRVVFSVKSVDTIEPITCFKISLKLLEDEMDDISYQLSNKLGKRN